MKMHITINGSPLCVWTGCLAHMEAAQDLGVSDCDYSDALAAIKAAQSIKAHRPASMVCVVIGDCPENYDPADSAY